MLIWILVSFLFTAVITIVDKMIKLSRRVIIILMPDLYCGGMQSLLCEQELAVYSALIQEETKVILIQLDKIKDFNSMPESLRYLKQKHGILTWRGTFTETTEMATTRFWKNVRYQMPASPSPLSSDLHFLPITFHSSQISDGWCQSHTCSVYLKSIPVDPYRCTNMCTC